jgi:hypothetical protein
MLTEFRPRLFVFYVLALVTSITLAGSMQWLQDHFTKINLRTFTSLTYLTQIVGPGSNTHPQSSQLENIVPKREVLYVGGQYTNITVHFDSHCFASTSH